MRMVLSTCPADRAEPIAEALLAERLCACVNVLPGGRSLYRWQGAIERSEESLLVIKTTAAKVGPLIERLKSLHPYEVPEAIAFEIREGHPAYLEWVRSETA